MSRIGKNPVPLPEKVEATVANDVPTVKAARTGDLLRRPEWKTARSSSRRRRLGSRPTR